jgi:hypothetical protein
MGFWKALSLTRAQEPYVRLTAIGWTGTLIALAFEMYWDVWRGFTYNAMLWFTLGLIDGAASWTSAARARDTNRLEGQLWTRRA